MSPVYTRIRFAGSTALAISIACGTKSKPAPDAFGNARRISREKAPTPMPTSRK